MEISKKAPTIFDVARLAGVSRGTIDRVLYGRGRVSQSTLQKVQDAIATLGFSPNLNASSLASRKKYVFSCLIPKFVEGDYWGEIYKGLCSGIDNMVKYNISLDINLYDQINVESFKNSCRKILETRPNGVIMNAVFKEEVTQFAESLEAAGIPYAFLDNKIDDLNYLMYYGVDPYKSGALGAFLLTTRCDVKDILLVRLIRDLKHRADPNAPRRHGFIDYIEENLPQCRIHSVHINPECPEDTYTVLDRFFKEHPEVKHVAATNSRIWLLDEYLEKNPDPERIVVGFDDLEKNLDSLRKGNIEYLVTRHIPHQASLLLEKFSDCVISGTKPKRRNNYVHMDILHRRNMDDY